MNKSIKCPCGFVIDAEDDDSLVARAQEHAKKAHGQDLSREEALAMAQPS